MRPAAPEDGRTPPNNFLGQANTAKDPENRYLWRRNPIRLEAEVVRDSILSLAGTLDPTIGGPPVPPADQNDSQRRSLYFFHSNNDRNLFLTTFDEAGVKECYRRDQSIVPQQAMALTNSKLVLDSASRIAARLSRAGEPDQSPSGDVAFIHRAFLEVLGIAASEAEVDACRKALENWRKQELQSSGKPDAARTTVESKSKLVGRSVHAEPSEEQSRNGSAARRDGLALPREAARAHLVWALLNHNDFVTLR